MNNSTLKTTGIKKAALAVLLFGSLLSVSAMAEVRVSVGMQFDNRHGHNHYYPAPGVAVRALPRDAYVTRYRGEPYYFREGVWYRRGGPGYVVARPPIGMRVAILPAFYTTLWFGGIPYYYADYAYYRWDPVERVYVVSDAPAGNPDREDNGNAPPASSNSDLFIYPTKGQSEEQKSTDRYECHRWAVDQTGYDPSKANPSNPSAYDPQPYQPSQRPVLKGAGRGAAMGAVGGAIAGDAGKGAAAGAAIGGMAGGFRRMDQQRQYNSQQQAKAASAASSQQMNYTRAMAACLEGRG